MYKIWIKHFGHKDYKYFDDLDDARSFIEDLREVNEDPNCCGLCGPTK
jgi:hypothetical protein